MVNKIEPDREVTALLSGVITKTAHNWEGLPTGPDVSEAEFLAMKIPQVEVYKKSSGQPSLLISPLDFHRQMPALEACAKMVGAREVKNHCLYLPQTVMPWHTNRDEPGKRTYYSMTLGRALFRWMDAKGQIHVDEDEPGGWTAREFDVSANYPMWHSIWTEKTRFSFGFLG